MFFMFVSGVLHARQQGAPVPVERPLVLLRRVPEVLPEQAGLGQPQEHGPLEGRPGQAARRESDLRVLRANIEKSSGQSTFYFKARADSMNLCLLEIFGGNDCQMSICTIFHDFLILRFIINLS
jgi:hypothetical protein